jgi:hypothetical protein
LTPGLASLSGHESAISSLSSRRNSLTASSLHDSFPPSVVDYAAYGNTSPRQAPTSAPPGPQLIMPSLTVPRRRPFSVEGRSLGKLKILVTGRPGMLSRVCMAWQKIMLTNLKVPVRRRSSNRWHSPASTLST